MDQELRSLIIESITGVVLTMLILLIRAVCRWVNENSRSALLRNLSEISLNIVSEVAAANRADHRRDANGRLDEETARQLKDDAQARLVAALGQATVKRLRKAAGPEVVSAAIERAVQTRRTTIAPVAAMASSAEVRGGV